MSERVSFDDVLQEVMLKEKTPSYAALLRSQERFPNYRDMLADFFATWAVQEDLPEELEPDIEDEPIVAKGVQHAMEILERQGRLLPKEHVAQLSASDQLVLAAVHMLDGEGDGVTITEKISQICGREALLGTTFAALSRLEKQGLIEAWQSVAETEPGGKSKRHFTITVHGEGVLVSARTSALLAAYLGGIA